ncbi:hypothetical protein [Nonomuraea sp. NPDC049028]|uniref:glucuronyl esterase domain-containing protein n=1 Tax=Nonomuraea sp. NPDC049028 TaxID=3364348 RepID=UPI0037106CD4
MSSQVARLHRRSISESAFVIGAFDQRIALTIPIESGSALGAGNNITYWSDIQDGNHCANRPEWRAPLQQNNQKFLLKTGNAATPA